MDEHEPSAEPKERTQRRGGKRTSGEHTHHLTFAAGAVLREGGDAGRWALEYETDWDPDWGVLGERFGIGFQLEVNPRPLDQLFVAPQLTYHPFPEFRFVLAPGYALREGEEDLWVLRTGIGYEEEIGSDWSLGPEVFVDFEEGGEENVVVALALGFGF